MTLVSLKFKNYFMSNGNSFIAKKKKVVSGSEKVTGQVFNYLTDP